MPERVFRLWYPGKFLELLCPTCYNARKPEEEKRREGVGHEHYK